MNIVLKGLGHVASDEAGERINLREKLKTTPARSGRLDDFSCLGLAAIGLALEDACQDVWQHKRNIGLIASSCYGCLESDVKYYETVLPEDRSLASPNLFAYTLPNSFVGEASICYGLTGINYMVYDQNPSQLIALKMAWDSLRWGEATGMVAGVLDRPCPEGVLPNELPQVGAYFVLLEVAEESSEGYGCVTFDDRGRLFLSNKPITHIRNLFDKASKNERH